MEIEIICGRGCGFRVGPDYYLDKPRFAPGICARCNGPVSYVRAGTDDQVEGVRMVLAGPGAGRLVMESGMERMEEL